MSSEEQKSVNIPRQPSEGISHPSSNHGSNHSHGFLGQRQLFREKGETKTVLRLMDRRKSKIQARTTGVVRESEVEEVFSHKEAGEARRRWKTAQLYARAAKAFSVRHVEVVDEEEAVEEPREDPEVRQYRLRAKKQYVSSREWIAGQVLIPSSSDQQIKEGKGWRFDTMLTKYLHWTFRTSFTALLVVSAAFFWAFCLLFAGFFTLFGSFQPSCIYVGDGVEFGESGFADAFHLSWTTFSTVGYGLTYPQVSSGTTSPCVLMNMFASFEAFVGVIFVGFVGAVIFGKIVRVQSFADVEFSDPMVVRYGPGVLTDENHQESDQENKEDGVELSSTTTFEKDGIPLPILEFRIINLKYNTPGGEILNASVNCTAIMHESEATPSIRMAADRQKSLRHLKEMEKQNQKYGLAGAAVGRIRNTISPKNTISPPPTIDEDESLIVTEHETPNQRVTLISSTAKHTVHDVDPSGLVVPRRIFSNLDVDTPSHPLFRRVWNIRHILDHDSPLLTPVAKRKVVLNGGSWPEELNSHQKVRDSIHFKQIIVSFSGTANASANTVYAQKVYDFVDINIGYTFVNVLHMDQGRLQVDASLINDVREQRGGGAEPFENVEEGFFQRTGEVVTEAVEKTGEAVTGAVEKTGEAVTGAVDNIKETIGQKDDLA